MPFTFSHPAAVLPLIGRRDEAGWKEALVLGSLAPDLLRPLFSFDRGITHSPLGWLLIDTPAALAAAWLVQRLLTPRIRRLPGFSEGTPAVGKFCLTWSLVAAMAGGLTHLGWDLFTHDGAPLTRVGILSRPLFLTPAGPFLLGKTLWYANSFLGLAALAGWLLRKIHRSREGLRALLSWTWPRILIPPALPFLFLMRGFQRHSPNLAKDVFLHVFYLTDNLPQLLLIPSAAIGLGMFLWETRDVPPS